MNFFLLALLLLMVVALILSKLKSKGEKPESKVVLFSRGSKERYIKNQFISGIVVAGFLLLMVALVKSGVL